MKHIPCIQVMLIFHQNLLKVSVSENHIYLHRRANHLPCLHPLFFGYRLATWRLWELQIDSLYGVSLIKRVYVTHCRKELFKLLGICDMPNIYKQRLSFFCYLLFFLAVCYLAI